MNCKQSKLRDAVLIALAVGITGASGAALAQDSGATTLDRLEVTGSRIKRAEIEGALPVVVIDRASIDASGDVSVSDFLRDTTFNSFGSYQSTSGSSGAGSSQISMRGLGSSRTLILVDGRRAPNDPILGGGQNLNLIPMAAVERIEVLSDGASSIYGSDALGGVINIITRKNFDGVELMAGFGSPSEAGGDTEEYSIVAGASNDRGNVLFGASYSQRDVVFTRDRDYWYSAPGASSFSNNFLLTPATSLTAAARFKHPTYGAAVPGDCLDGSNLFYTIGSGTGTSCQYDHSAISAQLTGMKNTSAFGRANFEVSENWSFNAAIDVSRVESFGRFAPVPSSPFPGTSIKLEAGSPNHPGTAPADGGLNPLYDAFYAQYANQDLYLMHRFASLGPRDSYNSGNSYNILAGFTGVVADKIDIDFGMRYSETLFNDVGRNYVVGGLAQAPITSGEYNIYDPFSGNPSALGFTATIGREMKSTMKELYASATFPLFQLAGGEAQMVVGGEYRKEYYADIYDSLSEAGQIVGSAGNSAAGGRDLYAGYFEALFPFTNSFEVNLSARYDKYSDYGHDTSPKIGLRWHPIDSLTLRASYGQGFRAPTLDLVTMKPSYSATYTSDSATCMLQLGVPTCPTQVQVSTYGIANPNLSSETSKQWSAGIVWDATSWLNASLDWYNIKIEDQIASVSLATIARCLRGQPGLCPSGLTSFPVGTTIPNAGIGLGVEFDPITGGMVSGQTGYTNLGYTETSGADFALRTNFELGAYGLLRNSLQVSYVHEMSSNGGDNVVGLMGYPEFRASFNTNWSLGDFSVNWNISHIDSTESDYSDYGIPSWTTHSLQASYKTPWNANISIGVNNLANKAPAYDHRTTSGTSYDSYLYDPWGRVPYIRYSQKF